MYTDNLTQCVRYMHTNLSQFELHLCQPLPQLDNLIVIVVPQVVGIRTLELDCGGLDGVRGSRLHDCLTLRVFNQMNHLCTRWSTVQ